MTPDLRAKIIEVTDGSSNYRPAEGWCTQEKALALAGLVLGMKPEIVVEVGVFGGRSLIPMALALQRLGKGHAYGVDPWTVEACLEGENARENDEWWSKLDLEAIYRSCQGLVQRYALEDRCCLMRCKSENAAGALRQMIDCFHLDANHSEETSCQDVELWLPKVRSQGFVAADDVDWPTMQKCVQMLNERCEYIGSVGTTKLFIKP